MENIFYAVIGLLDDSAQQVFHELWDKLNAKGLISKVRSDGLAPHITFAIYEGIQEDKILNWVEGFCKKEYQISINFNHMGLFFDQTIFIAGV